MSRVITFSRQFPSYHPRKGEPTGFVEKVWKSVGQPHHNFVCPELMDLWITFNANQDYYLPKHHTIRAGHRFKAGDWFSPRVWSGKPYASKMIQFAPDIQVKKTWNVDLYPHGFFMGEDELSLNDLKEIANNDGLTFRDFMCWFPSLKTKVAMQIICWNESIEY